MAEKQADSPVEKLDYRKIENKLLSDGKFPVTIEGEYRVFFEEAAHEAMKQHASTTVEVELCGVLVGEVKRDANGPFLLIRAAIEGKHSNNHGAQVTFTHHTWDYINGVKDKQYPNMKIVGWYHTHPGFGIFLSKMDLFIQESTFNHPFQVAVVLETKKNQIGCFAWVDGKCVPLSRYWVGQNELKLTTGVVEETEAPVMTSAAGASAMDARPRYSDDYNDSRGGGGFSFLSLLSLVIFFACGVLIGRMMSVGDRSASLGSIESEVYSVIEYAGLTQLAARDFADVREKVNTAMKQVSAKDPGAEETLKQTAATISTYEKTYSKHRQTSREEMEKLVSQKRLLSERINLMIQKQGDLEMYTGNLYMMRVMEELIRNGKPLELEKLSPPEVDGLKRYVEIAIQLNPGAKELFNQAHPQLFDFLYPKPKAPESKAPADGGKK